MAFEPQQPSRLYGRLQLPAVTGSGFATVLLKTGIGFQLSTKPACGGPLNDRGTCLATAAKVKLSQSHRGGLIDDRHDLRAYGRNSRTHCTQMTLQGVTVPPPPINAHPIPPLSAHFAQLKPGELKANKRAVFEQPVAYEH